ncbi:MAG: radical SAM protein [Nitrospirota bacterium]
MGENLQRKVLPYFWPPSLILRQVGSILYFGQLIKWHKLPYWFLKSSIETLPVASGAYGMGGIGFPAHPVWEVTSACNLRCIHCHVSSGESHPDELTTQEGFQLLSEITSIKEFRMLVLTGGEPLVHNDIFELINYGKKLGLRFVIATNGTLINEEIVLRLKENGVVGVAISLDSSIPQVHNSIRNHPRAYES